MLFNSYIFIFVFLPVTLAGFYLLGNRAKPSAAIAWLLLASLFFYAWWNPAYILLMFISMTGNFWFANLIAKSEGEKKRKLFLAIAIGINISLLLYYKYANFFVRDVMPLAGFNLTLQTIILPLGISFFTFTQIAYLVDVHRRLAHEYNIVHYFLFVTYFPHLIAGPILHHKEMMPQFRNPAIFRIHADNFSIGTTIFVIGLFKKVIFADTMAEYASPVFKAADSGMVIHPMDAWGGALAYTLQLYFDFSGYSDMAIGLSRMFGIILPLNFHSPYKSESIIEFWRRWHMTLSRFLRDYLYIGLGGNRHGTFYRYRNMFLTMLLGGIWHGAGWTYILWGAIHGGALVINHAWRAFRQKFTLSVLPKSITSKLSVLFTCFIVMLAWVLFRAETIDGAFRIYAAMSEVFQSADDSVVYAMRYIDGQTWRKMCVLLLIVWAFPNTQQIMSHHNPALDHDKNSDVSLIRFRWQPTFKWACLVAILAAFSLGSLSEVSEFIYFQF